MTAYGVATHDHAQMDGKVDTIGVVYIHVPCIGCFGRVYRGTLSTAENGEQDVAIKTLKGL